MRPDKNKIVYENESCKQKCREQKIVHGENTHKTQRRTYFLVSIYSKRTIFFLFFCWLLLWHFCYCCLFKWFSCSKDRWTTQHMHSHTERKRDTHSCCYRASKAFLTGMFSCASSPFSANNYWICRRFVHGLNHIFLELKRLGQLQTHLEHQPKLLTRHRVICQTQN